MEKYDKNVTAILEFLVAKNFSASVMRVYYLINGLKGIPL